MTNQKFAIVWGSFKCAQNEMVWYEEQKKAHNEEQKPKLEQKT